MAEAQAKALWDVLGEVPDHRSPHGRRFALQGILAVVLGPCWPGVPQVCRTRWERTVQGERSTETSYAMASLCAEGADAARLLQVSRRHWGIENRLHCVRDLTSEEDRCRVRAPAAAQALAALRNTALTVLRRLGFGNIRAAVEHCADHRQELVRLVRYGTTEWP